MRNKQASWPVLHYLVFCLARCFAVEIKETLEGDLALQNEERDYLSHYRNDMTVGEVFHGSGLMLGQDRLATSRLHYKEAVAIEWAAMISRVKNRYRLAANSSATRQRSRALNLSQLWASNDVGLEERMSTSVSHELYTDADRNHDLRFSNG